MRIDTDKHNWFKHFPPDFEKKLKLHDCLQFDKEIYDSNPFAYIVITKGYWNEDCTLLKGTGPKGIIEQVTIKNDGNREYKPDTYDTEGFLQFSVTCYSGEAEEDDEYYEDHSYEDSWSIDGRFVIIEEGQSEEDLMSDLREHLSKHGDSYDLLMIPIESIFKYYKKPAESSIKLTSKVAGKWFNVYYSKRTDRIIFGKSYGEDDVKTTLSDVGDPTEGEHVMFLATINMEDHPAVREMLISKELITKTIVKS